MKSTITYNNKIVSFICSLLLFLAVMKMPIGYYTALRVIIFIGSLLVIIRLSNKIIWATTFTIIAILFNPIIPVYLYLKSYWIAIDIIAGILFLLILVFEKPKKENNKIRPKSQKTFKRDKIY